MKMTRFVVFLLFFFSILNFSFADPVDGEKILLKQPDGKSIIGYIYGDEYYHRIETEEGYTIVLNEKTGYIEFAVKKNGQLIPSGLVVGRIRTQKLERFKIQKHLSERAERIEELRRTQPEIFHDSPTRIAAIGSEGQIQALTGNKNVFIVCVEFQPESSPPTQWSTGTYSPYNFHNRIFSTDPNDFSMVNFFKTASFNSFWPKGYTYPYWITLPQTATWYKDNSSWRQIVEDAMDRIKVQDPSFDFIQYADNGTMDICVIWAGCRETWASFFWPKAGGLSLTKYGVSIPYYITCYERRSDGAEETNVDTLIHEYAHITGAPDLYDYSDFHLKTLGYYCIMASPSYLFGFCGYIKYKVYGWVTPVEIVESGSYTVDDLAFINANNPQLYKINIEPPGEYLLIEKRNSGAHPFEEQHIWRSSGLLITHIDENYPPASCQPHFPFYGVEAIVPWLDPTITKLGTYSTYYGRMTFSADNGYTKIGPAYPDNYIPGSYLVLTNGNDTEHVIFRNTRGHRIDADINIDNISNTENTMTFDVPKKRHTLKINTTIGGTTDPAPGIHAYDPGSQIDVTAIENMYYVFSGWTGDIYPFDPLKLTHSITMDKDRIITAHFAKIYKPAYYSAQKVLNRSLFLGEYINVIRWAVNPQNSPLNIAYYRIYKIDGEDKELIQEVASNVFECWHRKVNSSGTYVYEIVAVTSSNREGEPAQVTVHQ